MRLADKYLTESDVEDKKKINKMMKELEKIAKQMEKIKFQDQYFKGEAGFAINYIWTAIKVLKDTK